jgi:hypothetical protein
MNQQLQYWVDQWMQGVASIQAMIRPEDAMVLGVVLALLVASFVFAVIWLRRRRSVVHVDKEAIEPSLSAAAESEADVPRRQITAAEFLAQIQGENPVLQAKAKTEPHIVPDNVLEPEPELEQPSDTEPVALDLQQEVQELRLALSAVQDQVRMQSSALLLQSEAIRAMEAYMELLDNRQHSTFAAADSAPVNDYDTAINLASKGIDTETLMARTGISATEAELITRLHGQGR